MQGFLEFIRTQGVVGLAVGFLLGGAVSKLVTSLIENIVNPLLGLLLGVVQDLKTASVSVGSAEIVWGAFVSTLIDFAVIAAIVYFGVKGLGFEKIDKPKA